MLLALATIAVSNNFIHFNPCSLLIHLFILCAKYQSFSAIRGIQLVIKLSPLKNIIGGIVDPSTPIHSIIVIHFYPLDCA